MIELISAVLILLGSFFMLVAAIGVLRMPDLLLRMHAATKAGTLGAGLLLFSIAVVYGETSVTIRSLVAIVFLLLTAPVAAHVIGRAAYLTGAERLWRRTFVDELAGKYHQQEMPAPEDPPQSPAPQGSPPGP
jgi:multicomponent Na+:H+ antiporter subunit G